MKIKISLLLVFFININYFCYAQAPDANAKKAETLQVTYFTKELALTPDESSKFWPLYNNYKNEIKGVSKDDGTDPIASEEKVLNIRKKYKNDFKKVLGSDDRVNKVYVLEKSFTEMLRNELLDRRGNS